MKKFLVELVNRSGFLAPLVGVLVVVLAFGGIALTTFVGASAPEVTVTSEPVVEKTVSETSAPVVAEPHWVSFSTSLGYGLVCLFETDSLTESSRECVLTEGIEVGALDLTEAFSSVTLLTTADGEVLHLTYGAEEELYVPIGDEWIAD